MKTLQLLVVLAFAIVLPTCLNAQQLSTTSSNYQNQETFAATQLFKHKDASQKNLPELSEFELLTIEAEALATLRYAKPEQLNLALPKGPHDAITLVLEKVDLPSPSVLESATQAPVRVNHAVHYRGHVQGDPNSIVAISFLENELMGLVASPSMNGNWVLGPTAAADKNAPQDEYIFYSDEDVFQDQVFSCATPDSGVGYTREELSEPTGEARGVGDCVKVYFEVNYDIFLDKGTTQATIQYIEALFNQVAAIFANEQIELSISEIFVWNTPSPYNGTSSGQMLTDFQNNRTNFNGDLAQLLSYQASGGIAVVDGLCHPFNMAKMSYSGIGSNFNPVPTYSWSVMVVAHELGHLLGSQHTHACVWNGNNTALDGCPGYTEGNCGNPGLPSGGGTIMSYCHLSQAGIDLSKGFGLQPGSLIRNRIAAANCLTTCSTGGGNNGGNNGGDGNDDPPIATCAEEEVFFRLQLDTYTLETTWTLSSADGTVVAQGGPYPKTLANQLVLDTLCLPENCYTFQINDSQSDGICCDYGQGSYSLMDAEGMVLAQGGSFPAQEETSFCVPFEEEEENECTGIDFTEWNITSYGINQDGGSHDVQDNGQTLYIENNAWKEIEITYDITPNTVVAFDFKSTRQGEIHGIGFDDNEAISYGYTFKVHGVQTWGISTFDNYAGNGQWQSYTIPVGAYYVGMANRLFFVADHDGGSRNGNSWFRNVRIYEGEDCETGNAPTTGDLPATIPASQRVQVYPNPVIGEQLNLHLLETVEGPANWEIISLTGQSLLMGQPFVNSHQFSTTVPTQQLANGTYLLRWRDEQGEQTVRFSVQ